MNEAILLHQELQHQELQREHGRAIQRRLVYQLEATYPEEEIRLIIATAVELYPSGKIAEVSKAIRKLKKEGKIDNERSNRTD